MIGKKSPDPFFLAMLLLGGVSACRDTTEGVRMQFVGSHTFTPAERRTIAKIAGETTREVRQHLPALPPQITIRVQSGADVIAETGESGTAMQPDWVVWIVNPDHPDGVVTIAEKHLRAALFHELHHMVRTTTQPLATLMDYVVLEGLAAAFERDFAHASYPWSDYPDDVSTWVDELIALPPDTDHREWIARERNGRRWIGMRAGAYLADAAAKKLHRTSAQLVSTPTAEILAAAR